MSRFVMHRITVLQLGERAKRFVRHSRYNENLYRNRERAFLFINNRATKNILITPNRIDLYSIWTVIRNSIQTNWEHSSCACSELAFLGIDNCTKCATHKNTMVAMQPRAHSVVYINKTGNIEHRACACSWLCDEWNNKVKCAWNMNDKINKEKWNVDAAQFSAHWEFEMIELVDISF